MTDNRGIDDVIVAMGIAGAVPASRLPTTR